MFQICESHNFLWSTQNVLGKGATSTVYQGVNKLDGVSVAVKCYNLSIFRPEEQFREFQMLQRIKHENIVKFMAIDENLADRKKVIVMELCTGGSLLTNLMEPKNAYGLEESEFLLVLEHLCSGMKYLRDNNIVHRDLKPGNIMKFIQEDGTNVYKLTDFGTARELGDDETFESLCGTEQYLHPCMYERAILGRPNKEFNSSVDLWSIGVTLYHVATGTLPFRVYSAHKAKETWHHITTKKESGVISGVQTKAKGPITWSRELPICLLSDGIKQYVTKIIAGLLEADYSKMWGFEKFFSEANILLSNRIIHIFYVNKAELIKVYLLPDQKYQDLEISIKSKTGIEADSQILLYKSDLLKNSVQECTKISQYPKTSEDQPLFLYNKLGDRFFSKTVQIPDWIDFPINISVENDITPAKYACITGNYCIHHIKTYSNHCKLIYDSVENLVEYIDRNIRELQLKTQHLYEKICVLKKPVQMLQLLLKVNIGNCEKNCDEKLKNLSKEFATVTTFEVTNLYSIQCVENTLRSNWDEITKNVKCPFKTRAAVRGKTQIEVLEESWQHFQNQPVTAPVCYRGGQWHILERKKIRLGLSNIINLLENEVFPQYQQLARHFESWYESVQKTLCKIDGLKLETQHYDEALQVFEKDLATDYTNRIKENEQSITKQVDIKKSVNSDYIRRYFKDYNKNRKNFHEILSENTRLMNQIDDFTKRFRL